MRVLYLQNDIENHEGEIISPLSEDEITTTNSLSRKRLEKYTINNQENGGDISFNWAIPDLADSFPPLFCKSLMTAPLSTVSLQYI